MLHLLFLHCHPYYDNLINWLLNHTQQSHLLPKQQAQLIDNYPNHPFESLTYSVVLQLVNFTNHISNTQLHYRFVGHHLVCQSPKPLSANTRPRTIPSKTVTSAVSVLSLGFGSGVAVPLAVALLLCNATDHRCCH
jgi:hypothetical protein